MLRKQLGGQTEVGTSLHPSGRGEAVAQQACLLDEEWAGRGIATPSPLQAVADAGKQTVSSIILHCFLHPFGVSVVFG